ncbi:MAG: 30S ribosomal protein S6 [Minisyncoccia bacterium]
MEDAEKIKKEYEIGVLVRKEDDLAEVRRVVEQHGGEFVHDFQAKKIAFAYPIEKEKEGIFAFCHFRAETAAVKQLEQDLTTAHVVLRSLIVIPARSVGSNEAEAGRVWSRPARQPAPASEARATAHVLSNEALEKKIEEMLK